MAKRREDEKDPPDFERGDRVVHDRHGLGEVEYSEGSEVLVRFPRDYIYLPAARLSLVADVSYGSSACCRAPMVTIGRTTQHSVCTVCGEPCDGESKPTCLQCGSTHLSVYERRLVSIVDSVETICNSALRSVRCGDCQREWTGEQAEEILG